MSPQVCSKLDLSKKKRKKEKEKKKKKERKEGRKKEGRKERKGYPNLRTRKYINILESEGIW